MKKLRNILASIALVLVSAGVSFAQKDTENMLIDAVQAYADGRIGAASSILSGIISKSPDNDAAWYYKGLCDLAAGNAEAGREGLLKAVAIDSSNYWYRYNLAISYSMAGNKELMVAELEKLAEDFPKKTDVYYHLISLYLSEQQFDKALATLDEINALSGQSDYSVMTRYRILLQQKKPEEAYKVIKEYSDEYASPQALTLLGDHEMGMYNDSLAIAYYDEALSLDRDFAPARLGKAEAFRMTRKYPEFFAVADDIMADDDIAGAAKADYIQALVQHSDARFLQSFRANLDTTVTIALRHHPKDTSIVRTAGIYYYLSERPERSADLFRSNMENYPDSPSLAAGYLQMLIYMKDWDALTRESHEAFGRFPTYTDFLEMANVGEFNRKNYRAIIENCEKIIASVPGDSAKTLNAYASMGDMYHQLEEPARAYASYEKALKINPSYAPVLNNYAYYLSLGRKKLKKAYKMSRKTIEAEPDNATYLDTFGWILHLLGRDSEAKPVFKHAMLYGGKDNPTVMMHYALVLERLGEDDLAKVYKAQAKAKAGKEE